MPVGESPLAHAADAGVGSTDLHGTVKHLHLSRTVLPQSTTGSRLETGCQRETSVQAAPAGYRVGDFPIRDSPIQETMLSPGKK